MNDLTDSLLSQPSSRHHAADPRAKMPSSTEYDPFATADLIALPPLDNKAANSWDGFHFLRDLENTSFYLPAIEKTELPTLEPSTLKLSQEDVTLDSLDASSSSSAYDTAEDEIAGAPKDDESATDYEDLWILSDVKNAPKANKLNSWDSFANETHREPPTAYLSEAGARTFDAVLAVSSPGDPPKIAPDGLLLDALFELAMGRMSQYMRWDEQHRDFVPTTTRLTISGFSPELIGELQASLASMGKTMRFIETSVFDSTMPGQLAFFSSLRMISTALQSFLLNRRSTVVSVVQLQDMLTIPCQFVACLEQLISAVLSSKDDIELLRSFLEFAQHQSMIFPRCQPLFNNLLSAVAGPVLASVEADLQAPARRDEEESASLPAWTTLLPSPTAQVVSEIAVAKTLLLDADPASMMEKPSVCDRLDLKLTFSWEQVATLQEQLSQAEFQARTGTAPSVNHDAERLGVIERATMDFQHLQLDELSPSPIQKGLVELEATLSQCLDRDDSVTTNPVPHDQILDFSVSPVIAAEHRLATFAILGVLFQQSNLCLHLQMIKNFLLLGNGSFASRISTALFDSSQSSGEGARRDGSTTGLRLQDRDTWPPTSSELRLVLMGILTEHLPSITRLQFEEAISFSLRDLNEEQMERCRDVDSIYALDFLRMHYKAPNPVLEVVITNRILDKYDRVFQYLLRLLRVHSVAQDVLRAVSCRSAVQIDGLEHRLRIDIYHAISTLADHAHNIAIATSWGSFDNAVHDVRQKVSSDNYSGLSQAGYSLKSLEALHEVTLDSILKVLLLKEKQSKTRKMIEELFSIVLSFAASLRKSTPEHEDRATTTKRYYDEFKTCINRLKDALHKEGELAESLLLRLSM